jgi:hypothetical protein
LFADFFFFTGPYFLWAVASQVWRFFFACGYLRLQVARAFFKFCLRLQDFAGAPKEEEQGGTLVCAGAEPAEDGVMLPAAFSVAVGPAEEPALDGGAPRQPSPRHGGDSPAAGGMHGLAAVQMRAS